MRCEEFELELDRQADGEPASNAGALRQHAQRCDRCQELQAGMSLMLRHFEGRRVPQVSRSLTDRICAAAIRDRARPRFRPVRWLAAAALLGAASLVARLWTHSDTKPAPVAVNTHTPASPVGPEPDQALFPELDGPDSADPREPLVIREAVAPMSQLLLALGKSLGSPIRPIAASTSEAMNSLIRDLPDTESNPIPIPMMKEMLGPAPDKKMQGMQPSS